MLLLSISMEDLNKHQLILLTLLVSFVTSIATGIITFTLLQEAPIEVTQTINRVVERTIETVTPTTDGNKTIVKEVQIVDQEKLVLESIEKSTKSIARIKTLGADGNEIVVGLGVVVDDGVVVISGRNFVEGVNYTVLFHDNKSYSVAKAYSADGVVFLMVGKPANEKYTFYSAILGSAESLKLGQTIIALSGKTSNNVSIGRVSELPATGKIITDISNNKSNLGGPLLNLSGEIVGLEKTAEEENLSFIPINIVKSVMKTALVELAK